MKSKRILRNAAKCLKCGAEVESKLRHDLRWCSCRALGVDGGREYTRRLGDPADWADLTEYEESNGETT